MSQFRLCAAAWEGARSSVPQTAVRLTEEEVLQQLTLGPGGPLQFFMRLHYACIARGLVAISLAVRSRRLVFFRL